MDEADKRYEIIISDIASEMIVAHVRFLAQVSETVADKLRQV